MGRFAFKFRALFPSLLAMGWALVCHAEPAFIPLKSQVRPAADLLLDGKPILPEDAYARARTGEFDLADLQPVPSDFWTGRSEATEIDALTLNESEAVDYVGTVPSRAGNFRFTALQSADAGNGPGNFTFMISKRVHNVLLRKALLRRLGYTVPVAKRIARLKLRFRDAFEKEIFITNLQNSAEGHADRWVVENTSDHELVLQDVVAMEDQDRVYNAAMGFVPSSVVASRRVLSALLVPLVLADNPESVNLLSWSAGRIVSNQVRLDYDGASEFDCSLDDARWILKRIAPLKREDWESIVRAADLPEPVAKLLVEKLLSRRNDLLKLFRVGGFDKIKPNTKIETKPDLAQAQLTRQTWEGYGSRFSYGDPESPLSNSELGAWVKSRAFSIVVSNAMAALNSLPGIQTNDAGRIQQHQLRQLARDLMHYVETGEARKVPLGLWAFPRAGTQLLASRDVVTGTYLGTDNLVQLVDTVGVSVTAGAFIGLDGVPALGRILPVGVSGGTDVYYTRTYAHVKPIKSLKASLKYPFKNVAIPLFQRRLGRGLERLLGPEAAELPDAERKALIKEVITSFKEQFDIGESLIISDTVGAGLQASAGVNFLAIAQARTAFEASQNLLARMHIYRKDEDTIQIYRDFGNSTRLGAGIDAYAIIPVITLRTNYHPGKARVKMHTLKLTPDESRNPNLVRALGALQTVLYTQSAELLRSVSPAVEVQHKFKEHESGIGAFGFELAGISSTSRILVKNAQGAEKQLFRRYSAQSWGRDLLSYGLDAFSGLVGYFMGIRPTLSSPTGANLGYAMFGRAKNRIVTLEAVAEDGKLVEPYVEVSRIWNGWSLSQKKTQKLLDRLNSRYGYQFYPDTTLNETEKLALYHVGMHFQFYERGLRILSKMTDLQITQVFRNYSVVETPAEDSSDAEEYAETDTDRTGRFLWLRRKLERAVREGDLEGQSEALVKMVGIAEKHLSLEGLSILTGGDGGVYVTSRLEGFRKGDENGDTPYEGQGYGEYGSRRTQGPVEEIRRMTGMSESEFQANWLLRRML